MSTESKFISCSECAYLLETKRGSKVKYQCINSGFHLQDNTFGCSEGKPKEKKRNLTKLEDHPEVKVCSCCKKAKPLSEFYTRRGGKLYSYCKECHKVKCTASNSKRKASSILDKVVADAKQTPYKRPKTTCKPLKSSRSIPDPITIEITTFDLEELKVQIIKRCIEEYPFETIDQIASRLGISSRSLFRYANKYKLVFGFNPTSEDLIQDAISKLSALGYNITKK